MEDSVQNKTLQALVDEYEELGLNAEVNAALSYQAAHLVITDELLDQLPGEKKDLYWSRIISKYYIPAAFRAHRLFSYHGLCPVSQEKIKVEEHPRAIRVPVAPDPGAYTYRVKYDKKKKCKVVTAHKTYEDNEEFEYLYRSQRGFAGPLLNGQIISECTPLLEPYRRLKSAIKHKDDLMAAQEKIPLVLKKEIPAATSHLSAQEERDAEQQRNKRNPYGYVVGKEPPEVLTTDTTVFLPPGWTTAPQQLTVIDTINIKEQVQLYRETVVATFCVPHSVLLSGAGHKENKLGVEEFQVQRSATSLLVVAKDIENMVRMMLSDFINNEDVPVTIPTKPQATLEQIDWLERTGRIDHDQATEYILSILAIPNHKRLRLEESTRSRQEPSLASPEKEEEPQESSQDPPSSTV